jgi:hypothetical protein
MYKKGDKVVCINNGSLPDSGPARYLTIGTLYTIVETPRAADILRIKDDRGEEMGYYKERFRPYSRNPTEIKDRYNELINVKVNEIKELIKARDAELLALTNTSIPKGL